MWYLKEYDLEKVNEYIKCWYVQKEIRIKIFYIIGSNNEMAEQTVEIRSQTWKNCI